MSDRKSTVNRFHLSRANRLPRVLWLAISYAVAEIGRSWVYARKRKQFADVRADYEIYWNRRAADQRPPRFTVIAAEIEPDASVLDLGCGNGNFLAVLRESGHRGPAYGVDGSATAVELTRAQGFAAEVHDLLDPRWKPANPVDYVIASEVLEHLPEPEHLLTRLAESCRRGILISVPNTGYYRHRLRLLAGRFPIQWEWFPGEHLRYWTVADFREWAECLGLHVEKVIGATGFPVLCRLRPSIFAEQVVYRLSPCSRVRAEREPLPPTTEKFANPDPIGVS